MHRHVKVVVEKGRLKKKLSEIDLNQFQDELKIDIPDLESITMCSDNDEITEIILHRNLQNKPIQIEKDAVMEMNNEIDENPKAKIDENPKAKGFSIERVLDKVEKHERIPMETISEALQKTSGKSLAERLDNMEGILKQLPNTFKIKRV